MRSSGLFVFLLVSMSLYGAEADRGKADLIALNVSKIGDAEYLKRVAEKFPLLVPDGSGELGKMIHEPMSGEEMNGLATILVANGTKGYLWMLTQLHDTSATVRSNLVGPIRYLAYVETIHIWVELLNDKRPMSRPAGGLKREPPPAGRLVQDNRICDIALIRLCEALLDNDVLPGELAEQCAFSPQNPYEDRDKRIAVFLEWWNKQGNIAMQSANRLRSVIRDIVDARGSQVQPNDKAPSQTPEPKDGKPDTPPTDKKDSTDKKTEGGGK